ncbi:adenosylcobinamide-phosphate synthase CbiB [Tepidicaulis sp. LMO-SS28]|uniref:adenosylcobinamide-phosphate synthase CbiB n=1 Tax=Tepidicaulis sp. LMO-SS28 TaxID=3447455 RepID=UPI003EE275A6
MSSFLLSSAALALAAFLLEAAFGYSQRLYARIGHPVTWIGKLIAAGDTQLNNEKAPNTQRFLSGAALMLALTFLAGVIGLLLYTLLTFGAAGFLAAVLLASTLIASRSLGAHIRDVADALEKNGIEAGRGAVSRVVGRDVSQLEEDGISRAAIESLAENFSDGVTAPLFWCAIAGLPGLLIYKAVNTADSMIGHRNTRYEYFGKMAARLDDALNYIPARLTGTLIATAARSPAAFRLMLRDAGKHLSPNAGWPEAAMAGALDLCLGGPRHYGTSMTEGAWLGDGRKDATAQDIRAALHLYRRALALLVILLLIAVLILGAKS